MKEGRSGEVSARSRAGRWVSGSGADGGRVTGLRHRELPEGREHGGRPGVLQIVGLGIKPGDRLGGPGPERRLRGGEVLDGVGEVEDSIRRPACWCWRPTGP
jgi:hypothetical protein